MGAGNSVRMEAGFPMASGPGKTSHSIVWHFTSFLFWLIWSFEPCKIGGGSWHTYISICWIRKARHESFPEARGHSMKHLCNLLISCLKVDEHWAMQQTFIDFLLCDMTCAVGNRNEWDIFYPHYFNSTMENVAFQLPLSLRRRISVNWVLVCLCGIWRCIWENMCFYVFRIWEL